MKFLPMTIYMTEAPAQLLQDSAVLLALAQEMKPRNTHVCLQPRGYPHLTAHQCISVPPQDAPFTMWYEMEGILVWNQCHRESGFCGLRVIP